MSEPLLNTITLFAYTALAVDFLLQIHQVWIRKHSRDVSVVGVMIRTTAAAVILGKVAVVGDTYLIIGQAAMVALLFAYLAVLFLFKNRI